MSVHVVLAKACRNDTDRSGHLYVSVVIPVFEYACPVWHTNLPRYISDNI